MPSKIEVMTELERRGKLPENKKALLNEARKRGLIPEQTANIAGATPSTDTGIPTGVDPITPFLQRIAKGEGLPLAGETAGGLLAAKRSTPIGMVASGAGGAGLEAMRQMLQAQQGMPEAPQTSTEAAKRIGGAGVRGAAGEFAGRKIFNLLSKFAAPFKGAVTEEGRTAIDLVGGRGVVTPGEATNTRMLDVLENVAEGSFFGGGRIAATKKNTKNILSNTVDDLVSSIGPQTDRKQLRSMISDTLASGKETFETISRGWYKGLDKLVPSTTETITERVNTGILDAAGNPIYKAVSKEVQKGPVDIRSIKKMASSFKSLAEKGGLGEGATEFSKIIQKGDNLTFTEAKELRTSLFTLADSPELVGKVPLAKFTQLAGAVDNAMEKAARKAGGSAWEDFRNISEAYKSGSGHFRDRLIRDLTKKDADLVVDTLLTTREPISIEHARKIITAGDQTLWPKVQNAFMGRVINEAKDPITGELSAKKALIALSDFEKSGAAKEFFPKGETEAIKKALGGLHAIQEKVTEGTGRIAIQLMQAGALAGALTGGVGFIFTGDMGTSAGAGISTGGLVILGGPAAIGRLLTNPTTAKWLSTGFTLGPGTREATKFLGRLSALAASEGFKTMTYDQYQKMQAKVGEKSFLQRLANLPTAIAPQASRAEEAGLLSDTLRQPRKMRP